MQEPCSCVSVLTRGPTAFAAGFLFLLAITPFPANAEESATPLGAKVESLLAIARQLSPTLQAAALMTQAANARASGAGALPDPTLLIDDDEVDRTRGRRLNKTYFMFGQTFPLWGKRDLQHQAALRAIEAARGQERATGDQLEEQVKVAFAQYYAVDHSLTINADIARMARQMTGAANARYGQGQGSQGAALLAETEQTLAETESVRLEGDRLSAVARINALLARPAAAPLAKPLALRPLPVALPPITALMDRARAGNPQLFAGQAEIDQAETQGRLADKAWYPDPTISAGPVQRDNGPTGFSATLSFSIPLQQSAKTAGVREAAANSGAARMRLNATLAQIEGDLGQAAAALEAAHRIEALLTKKLLPQYQAVYRSTLAGYGQGRSDLNAVLDAEHRLHETNIKILRAQLDGQTALAAIERLIGGAL